MDALKAAIRSKARRESATADPADTGKGAWSARTRNQAASRPADAAASRVGWAGEVARGLLAAAPPLRPGRPLPGPVTARVGEDAGHGVSHPPAGKGTAMVMGRFG